jgi:hypothetical protein
MATHGNLLLKMMACGDRLQEAQRLKEKAQARFEVYRTEEGREEWRRARDLVENLAREYLVGVRAWRQSVQQEIAGVEASQHISPALREQVLLAGLPESEIATIAEHLRTCSECRCRIDIWEFWGGLLGNSRHDAA